MKAFLLFCGLCLTVLAHAADDVAAEVVFAAGTVRVIAVDGVTPRVAVRGSEIRSGEALDTQPDGRVQLRFRDGATLSLQPGTRFRLDEYRFSGGERAEEADRGFFSLLKGGFRTLSGLLGKVRRDQYRVTTPVATIGIRGTAYAAQLSDDGLSVSTQSGAIDVCNVTGCVLVRAGESAQVRSSESRPELKNGPQGLGGVEMPRPEMQAPPNSEATGGGAASAGATAPTGSIMSPSGARGGQTAPATAVPFGTATTTAPLR